MRQLIMILLVLLLTLGISACDDTAPPKEETPIPIEEASTIESEEIIHETNYEKISHYMEQECRKAYSPYYELLDFQLSNYEEKVVNGTIEAIFNYKMITKNYDKDPDTVDYIKEAKESGDINYQQLYDEYLQPQEGNFHLKIIIDQDDQMTLYSNSSPKGTVWEKTKMTDFIIK